MPGRGRGNVRGRGAPRGGRGGRGRRGASRGRGGSRGRGRGTPARPNASNKQPEVEVQLNIEKDLKLYFIGTASFAQHYNAQESHRSRYIAGLLAIEKTGVEVVQNAKIRALAAAWARKDKDLVDTLLKMRDMFGLVEVLKALELLDSARRIRAEEKRLVKLEHQNSGKLSPKAKGKIKTNIENLNSVKPKCGSASGAICKAVKRWAKTFGKEDLEFYALHYPSAPWCKLADIVHFHPTKDFNLDWFLPFCFGTPAPDDTMVARCKNMTAETVNILLEEFDVPFTHVKQFKDALTVKSKMKIAATDKLDKVIWNYEDLQCKEADSAIQDRLKRGEKFDLPYGKLMERLLTIKMIRENIQSSNTLMLVWYQKPAVEATKTANSVEKAPFFPLLVPFAEVQLKEISLSLETPVVVIGDKSSSMDVAIRTSTIIASLLTAIVSAKLVFFNGKNEDAPFIPKDIEGVLTMATSVKADGCTAPAAILYPFYERKEVVKTFIVVTDEEENTPCNSFKFCPLYKKYAAEVFPARLVFVSFLRSQHSDGQMVKELTEAGVSCMQFKFDQTRPDLTKLDTLFGLLSADSSTFESDVKKYEDKLNTEGLTKLCESLHVSK